MFFLVKYSVTWEGISASTALAMAAGDPCIAREQIREYINCGILSCYSVSLLNLPEQHIL